MARVVRAVAIAAAGIDQMREIEFVESLGLHQVEHRGQALDIALRDGEAQPDLDAAIAAAANARERCIEGSFLSPEPVMHRADAIEADADIVVAERGDAIRACVINERAIARQADIEAEALGAGRDFKDVRPEQRLATGEDEHGHAEGAQVIHHAVDFIGRKLAGKIGLGRERIAVNAIQVAAADQVPDHDRPWRHGAPHRRRLDQLAHEL